MTTWVLRGAATEYAVRLAEHGAWLEHVAWGPHGVADGPPALAYTGPTNFLTGGDVAAVEYATDRQRPFAGPDLAADGGVEWTVQDLHARDDRLTARFADDRRGLLAELHYWFRPGTDVLERHVRLANDGTAPIALVRAASACFCLPTPAGARLEYLWGQWSQEFQPAEVNLAHGRFSIGSAQGLPGHAYAPSLTVVDPSTAAAWGVAVAWTGSWEITADADASGMTRVRAGRWWRDPVELRPGQRLILPTVAATCSTDGAAGIRRGWHAYQRGQRGDRPHRVVYNSWEATGFDVHAGRQLELARIAAGLGVETFVVDDGWFAGRADDRGGLGDWWPDPVKFPDGFDAFIAGVRGLGLDFGLWVEPEAVSPRSRLYAEHPDWIHRVGGRPARTVRHQYLLDLGRPEVTDFVLDTVDRLLTRYPIGYLKWDDNRPRTDDRPGDPDGDHVAALYAIVDRLRVRHPQVVFEGCAGGGGRTDAAWAARMDVLWPSDNTGPLDRLAIQFGFLRANAPHLMSSWVTNAAGVFDRRPRSLGFRFVTAMAGVLGIGADISRWCDEQRSEAAGWVARYKEIRDLVLTGDVHMIGAPGLPACAVQYTAADAAETVVLAWDTAATPVTPHVPLRPTRLPLRGLRAGATYTDGEHAYSGSHLMWTGLPVTWTPTRDAAVVVLKTTPDRT